MLKKLILLLLAGLAAAYLTGHNPANFKNTLNGASQRGASTVLPTDNGGWGDPH